MVVLSGDHPLVTAEQIGEPARRRTARAGRGATLLTTDKLDPAGYGRIVRDGDGGVERIVETKYPEGCRADELAIREINLGTYAFEAPAAVRGARRGGRPRAASATSPPSSRCCASAGASVVTRTDRRRSTAPIGVNDRADLMQAEELAQRRILEHHARDGVTFLAPGHAPGSRPASTIGADTVIGPGVSLLGATSVGAGCRARPAHHALDSRIGDGASVVHSYLVEAQVADARHGRPVRLPAARHVVGEGAKVGTFVEVKNSDVGAGAKIPHLSYIGDADVGEGSNLGASTITANYDGRNKHRTTIGEGVKTGIHTSLVAPVDVGDRAYTGAGSVITEDVPEGALGIARAKQKNVEGYADRVEEDSQ